MQQKIAKEKNDTSITTSACLRQGAEGSRGLSERYGFTRLRRSDHDSEIYEQEWKAFLARVNN